MLLSSCHAGANVKGGGETSSTKEAVVGGRGDERRCRRGRQREMGLGRPLRAVSTVSRLARPRGHDRCHGFG
ncbi:hypothetical protein ACLOJK_029303 [Asimina triloba]